MAYLNPITETCQKHGCTSRATEELRSWRNERHGVYCRRHAKTELAALQGIEDRYREATS